MTSGNGPGQVKVEEGQQRRESKAKGKRKADRPGSGGGKGGREEGRFVNSWRTKAKGLRDGNKFNGT